MSPITTPAARIHPGTSAFTAAGRTGALDPHRRIALTLTDQSSMPPPAEWYEGFDPIIADFTCRRRLGDRKGIEQRTRTWNKIVVDRRPELSKWARVCYQTVRRGVSVFVCANNHFAGDAPATTVQFLEFWPREDRPERKAAVAPSAIGVLFPL